MFRKPKPLNLGSSVGGVLDACLARVRHLEEDPEGIVRAERYAMGAPLPEWQREACWSRQQQIELIESLWLDLPIGFYVINKENWLPGGDPHPLSGLLIDGQQRMLALEAYFNDEFEVFGAVWSDVPLSERRHFKRKPFPFFETDIENETDLRMIYNRLNFSGVRHRDDQQA